MTSSGTRGTFSARTGDEVYETFGYRRGAGNRPNVRTQGVRNELGSGPPPLDRKGEYLASREASGRREDAQTDHPDPSGDPGGVRECFDGDVAFLRLRDPEDDSGFGLVDVPLTFHTSILRDVRNPRPDSRSAELRRRCRVHPALLRIGSGSVPVEPVFLPLAGAPGAPGVLQVPAVPCCSRALVFRPSVPCDPFGPSVSVAGHLAR